jgi:hypothetical protein
MLSELSMLSVLNALSVLSVYYIELLGNFAYCTKHLQCNVTRYQYAVSQIFHISVTCYLALVHEKGSYQVLFHHR